MDFKETFLSYLFEKDVKMYNVMAHLGRRINNVNLFDNVNLIEIQGGVP